MAGIEYKNDEKIELDVGIITSINNTQTHII